MAEAKHIAIFDIGKTHKKLLLFDEQLKVVYQQEEKFPTTLDDDGFECDDIERIENWIQSSLKALLSTKEYNIQALNFSTYGATLVFLDREGKRLSPVYNYLKEIPETIQNGLFERYGGKSEFCRKTASPPLGLLLNSGIQILWFREKHPRLFNSRDSILHFPQYLSYLFTGKVVYEPTSIGCHTFLWDFDKNDYHQWLQDEGIQFSEPQSNSLAIGTSFEGTRFLTGIGIHDSSASLIPYIRGSREKFILVSAGTWSINMNPFNHTPLTSEELEKDCLAYLSINRKPVKSSRLFMGHIHDVNVKHLCNWYKVPENTYKEVEIDKDLLREWLESDKSRQFFKNGLTDSFVDTSVDLSRFSDFSEAYHRLMFDLTHLNEDAIRLISIPEDGVQSVYVSGGFARNPIFMHVLASFFPEKKVYTSEIDNSSALGAALVIWESVNPGQPLNIDLNIQEWESLV